ncbi:hypothetical protein CK5_00290 [Blautia obeum A2-162]|uniref:Uncharacterized protein n=1 Tax=Blautia obeum A2-162 TaxID=657314 RepID=D4LVM9_9FIRM|nr:hypothetical protein CK5_00290 [Blautia obeum A2-162]
MWILFAVVLITLGTALMTMV